MYQLGKRRVTLNDHRRVQWHLKLLANFRDSLGLVFSAAVCEEDEWDALFLQERERLGGAGDWFGGS